MELQTRRLTRMNSGGNIKQANPAYKDYVLDHHRALKKKEDSCSKPHIDGTMKPGNNLVIKYSTAAYELMKTTIMSVLQKSTHYSGHLREDRDSTGATVDYCIKVYNRKFDGSQGKTLKFTINLYHTQSSMLVNGSRVDLYMSDIHSKVQKEITSHGYTISALDNNIKSSLSHLQAPKTFSDDPTICNHNQHTSDLAITSRSDQSETVVSDDDDICPICNKISLTETIECSECNQWLHYNCAKVTPESVKTLKECDYICPLCTDNLLYKTDSNASINHIPIVQTSECPTHIDEDETSAKQILEPEAVATSNSETSTLINEITHIDNQSCRITHQTSEHGNDIKGSETSNFENITKKNKKTGSRPRNKIEHTEEKAYIMKLEDEIKILKSTIEIQKRANYVSPVHSSETNIEQQSSQLHSTLQSRIDRLEFKLTEQRIQSIEQQMAQNITLNSMIVNQQTQMMLQQQQFLQNLSVFNRPAYVPYHFNPYHGFAPPLFGNMGYAPRFGYTNPSQPPPGFHQNHTSHGHAHPQENNHSRYNQNAFQQGQQKSQSQPQQGQQNSQSQPHIKDRHNLDYSGKSNAYNSINKTMKKKNDQSSNLNRRQYLKPCNSQNYVGSKNREEECGPNTSLIEPASSPISKEQSSTPVLTSPADIRIIAKETENTNSETDATKEDNLNIAPLQSTSGNFLELAQKPDPPDITQNTYNFKNKNLHMT